jgi:TIR domain
MDVTNIKAGRDFEEELQRHVSECDVLLAIIGKKWIEAKDDDGSLRLFDASDWVRIEIESALRLGKRVIPVLINGAKMPQESELPIPLKPIATKQAVSIEHQKFNLDVETLIQAIEDALGEALIERQREEQARQAQVAKVGNLKPLHKFEIDNRLRKAIVPQYVVRLIARTEDGFSKNLSRDNSPFVFCCDLEEYRGRFLKDIIRDMFGVRSYGDRTYVRHIYDAATCWYAIKFELNTSKMKEYQLLPALASSMYHVVTGFSEFDHGGTDADENEVWRTRFRKLSETIVDTAPYLDNYPEPSEYFERSRRAFEVSSHFNNEFAEIFRAYRDRGMSIVFRAAFGVDVCFHGSGRGGAEYQARHFIVRNQELDKLSFEVQQLDRENDLMILT